MFKVVPHLRASGYIPRKCNNQIPFFVYPGMRDSWHIATKLQGSDSTCYDCFENHKISKHDIRYHERYETICIILEKN